MGEFLIFLIEQIDTSSKFVFVTYCIAITFYKEERKDLIKIFPVVCLAYFIGMIVIFLTQKTLYILLN
jgi:hypothetical protein